MTHSRFISLALVFVVLGAVGATAAQPQTFVLRVNAGDSATYTDKAGNTWQPEKPWRPDADFGFSGGDIVDRGKSLAIAGTDDPRLYQTERYQLSHFRAKVPDGTYIIRLHFAETYEDIEFDGPRVFDVKIEDKAVLETFDVQKTAGARNTALVREFTDVGVTDGELTIEFVPRQQNAMINAIEILAQ